MTGPQPPLGPDGAPLTAEEWDAVRRLRGAAPAEKPAEEAPAAEEPAAVEPAAEEPAAFEPAAGDDASAEERVGPVRRVPLPVPVLTVLVVVAVVAAALVAVTTARLSERHERSSDATAALAAATGGVATVLSYNYKSLDADFARAEALLTPAFRTKYVTTTAKAVQPLAAKYHAVSTAQVTSGGVITQSGSRVEVVVFVSQQVTNTQLSAPRLDRSRVLVVLAHRGDRWLIDNLTPV